MRSQHETPRGLLRVTAPLNIGYLGPIFSDYLRRHPEVRLELSANARVVDLIEERFDVGIRAGRLEDSSLVARSLGASEWTLVASPGYAKARGLPRTPADLAKHDCLIFGTDPRLTLVRDDGRREEVSLQPRLLVTDIDVLEAATKFGLGIAALPTFLCDEPLRARRLVRVLPSWSPPAVPLHIVYPSARHLSPTVRSFIDYVQSRAAVSPMTSRSRRPS